jgi:hypothetical protein
MAKGTQKPMAGTTDHDLADLVGKKIKSITMQEIDVLGNQGNVRQFYHILCSDGEKFVLACDGGSDDNQYATATLMDPDDFTDFLEQIESDDSEDDDPSELGDDDDEDLDEDEDLFDDEEDFDAEDSD